jgi:DNA helicase-2/ATP-dependent DNA helicase PcrA
MSLSEDLARLNQQQSDVIKKFNRPSLIVAGPGTGKTRTIAVLIGNLLHSGVRLKEILALTFSDKAANELRERVLEYFPQSFDQCWISTFHSFCARILREQYYRIFVQPDFKLLTGFKEALLMSGICARQDAQAFFEFGKVLQKRGFQQEILTFISLLKSNLVSHDDFSAIIEKQSELSTRTRNRLKEIASLYRFYENERKKCGYLDFRDLISLSIKVLQIPEAAAIYREKFKIILVDEFQDTDPAQYLLLSLLSGKDEKARIAVIGDPHQSIYRFRGADPDMMTKTGPFKQDFKAKVFPLQLNYRCSREIVEVASRLAWKNKSKDDPQLEAKSEEIGFVQLFNARDELEEARFLTRKIAALLIYGEKRTYKPEDIAILVRNNYQIDLLAENLQALHIPFEIAGDMKFFRSEEIIVLASLLKIAALTGTDRETAIQRAFVSPLFKIDPLWIQAVIAEINPSKPLTWFLEKISAQDYSELPEASEENILRAQYFAETIYLLEQCSEQSLNAVFARLLLTLPDLLSDPSSAEARNTLHFRNMIADYTELFQRQHHREALVSDLIGEFDEWLTYYASTLEQEQSTASNGVRIMTVHQSKGLEFPVVAVPGLAEGQFPVKLRENLLISTATIENLKKSFNSQLRPVNFFNPYPTSHEDHLEEERRLFFVALTRAKEGLLLSFPLRIGTDPAIPAPYLKEIGLQPRSEEIEARPLNLSEFRTRLALLGKEKLQQLEPQIQHYEKIIRDENSVYGVRPRQFINAELNEVSLPENFVFSASSLKNYLDCPRRFFFLNVLKIKDPLQAKQSWFQTGNAFHAILEELHRPGSVWEQGKFPDADDQDNLLQEKALPILHELDFFQRHQEIESIKETLPDYINAVYQNFQVPPRITRGVESDFSFTFHGCRFRGRFDRLIETESGLFVVDYKTTTNQPKNSAKIYEQAFPEEGLPAEIQMPLYLLACRHGYKKNASAIMLYVRLGLYKRQTGNMAPGFMRGSALNLGCGPEFGIEVSENAFARFEDQMRKILDEIRLNQKFDCRPSGHSDARSCLQFDRQRKPKCEFFAFCQERLEQLRYVRSENE